MNYIQKYKKIIIWILSSICIISIFSFIQYVRYQYHQGELRPQRIHREVFTRSVSIEGWMTFDYINKVYEIPSSYLQTHLSLTDIRYPYVSIDKYARMHGIPKDIFIKTLKESIASYEHL